MTALTDMTISNMMSGSGWMFAYEDRIHWRHLIAADEIEYDW